MSLAVLLAFGLVELLTQNLEFLFQLGNALIAFAAAGTSGGGSDHESIPETDRRNKPIRFRVLDPRCILILRPKTRAWPERTQRLRASGMWAAVTQPGARNVVRPKVVPH